MKSIIVGHHSLSIPSIVFLNVHDASYSLYRVLTLTTKAYMEALLKDESTSDGQFTSYVGSSP